MIVTLLQGQIFFVLGLSILFLIRRGARLEIARELVLLSVFGFCEAIAAWGTAWLGAGGPDSALVWLAWLRLLALGGGYAALLAFGLQVWLVEDSRWWIRWAITAGLFIVWLLGLVVLRLVSGSIAAAWTLGEIAVRYGFALPGGLLGAWALRHEIYRTIAPELLSLGKLPMRIASGALAVFALFGGLLGPKAPFFPAIWINQEGFLQLTGLPVSLFRGVCGAAIAYGILRTLNAILSQIDLWLENMEQMQALMSERERIGRDLHDGIIQAIYASGLMLESARERVGDDPARTRELLTRAIETLDRTIQDIRRYIFDLRGGVPEEDLEAGLRKLLEDFRVNTLLETSFMVGGGDAQRINAERRQHIFHIAREALTNVARHAQARRVEMDLCYKQNELELRISDDGVGLKVLPLDGGHGLRNIRERASLLNGALDISTAPGEGLTLTLTVPYT